MLERTFCHLDGLGVSAEMKLWRKGVLCWRDLRLRAEEFLGKGKSCRVGRHLDASQSALQRQAWRFFLQTLPCGERVRIWPHIAGRTAFIDIETTGLSSRDRITTAALLWKDEVKTYVNGASLHHLVQDLEKVEFLVSYNGDRFDLPLLRRELGARVDHPHLDMWLELYSRGFRGGLKQCERRFGIHREMSDLTGADTGSLWAEHLKGRSGALQQLLEYNAEDVVNLKRILVRLYGQSMSGHPMGVPQITRS